jgi:rhodanese-related sulfurtransferase
MEQQFVEFIGNHSNLFMALLTVLILLIWSIVGEAIQGIKNLMPQEATLLINHEDALVVDVREESEYLQGHILSSINIPANILTNKIGRLEKYRNRPIIISCMSGSRSASACSLLKKKGFEKVHNLKGGLIAWQNANLPLTKGKN